jgi:hypothetical protein
VNLYIHSPIQLHDVVLKYFSTRTTVPFTFYQNIYKSDRLVRYGTVWTSWEIVHWRMVMKLQFLIQQILVGFEVLTAATIFCVLTLCSLVEVTDD